MFILYVLRKPCLIEITPVYKKKTIKREQSIRTCTVKSQSNSLIYTTYGSQHKTKHNTKITKDILKLRSQMTIYIHITEFFFTYIQNPRVRNLSQMGKQGTKIIQKKKINFEFLLQLTNYHIHIWKSTHCTYKKLAKIYKKWAHSIFIGETIFFQISN